MFCPNCGKEVRNEAKYCRYCGYKLIKAATPESAPQASASSVSDTKKEKQKNKTVFTVIGIVVVVILAVLVISFMVPDEEEDVGIENDWYHTYNTFTSSDGETIQLFVSDYEDGLYGIDIEIDEINAATILFYEPEQMDDGSYVYSNGGMQWLKYYPDENVVQINFADGRGILTYEYSN